MLMYLMVGKFFMYLSCQLLYVYVKIISVTGAPYLSLLALEIMCRSFGKGNQAALLCAFFLLM